MARTQEQILERIRQLYPAVWVFDTLDDGAAIWQSIAKILSNVEGEIDQYISSACILEAEGNQLDLHGKGRGLPRGEGEPDDQYQTRLRSWEDQLTKPALEAGINALLPTPGAYIEEHLPDGGFYDRQSTFFNRDFHYYEDKFLFFTAFIPWQVAALLLDAFYDRQQAFLDRQNAFYENLEDPDPSIYKRVYQFIQRNRAAGVRFNLYIF